MQTGYSQLKEEDGEVNVKTSLLHTEAVTLGKTTKIVYGILVFLLLVGLIVVAVMFLVPNDQSQPIDVGAFLDENPLIDGHNDVPWQYRKFNCSVESVNFEGNVTRWQTDIPRLKIGKVAAQFWSVYVSCAFQGKDAVRATLEQIDVVKKMNLKFGSHLSAANTVADINKNFKDKKISSLMGVEGGHQIDASIATLRMMYELGVRYMTLTHACNNEIADSCDNNCASDVDCRVGTCNTALNPAVCTQPQNEGITTFGRSVISEMNRLGMLVDLSHVSPLAMHRALDISISPIIFSHSSVKALCNHQRNVPDDVLLRLPQNKGLVMITFLANFINCSTTASAAQVIDHIKYVATGECPDWKPDCNTSNFPGIGFDHIGLGSDFDGATYFPSDLNQVSDFYTFTEALLKEFAPEDVAKILGGNLLRVLSDNEAIAKTLNGTFPDETFIYPSRTCRSGPI
jgi:membrane dipeptidase